MEMKELYEVGDAGRKYRMYPSEELIILNLEDAGCDSEIIQNFIDDLRENRKTDGLKILGEHRQLLLDSLHKSQKMIDNLDYLIYQIQNHRDITAIFTLTE